jgi:hypothetical protein
VTVLLHKASYKGFRQFHLHVTFSCFAHVTPVDMLLLQGQVVHAVRHGIVQQQPA